VCFLVAPDSTASSRCSSAREQADHLESVHQLNRQEILEITTAALTDSIQLKESQRSRRGRGAMPLKPSLTPRLLSDRLSTATYTFTGLMAKGQLYSFFTRIQARRSFRYGYGSFEKKKNSFAAHLLGGERRISRVMLFCKSRGNSWGPFAPRIRWVFSGDEGEPFRRLASGAEEYGDTRLKIK
jgi:hypothetical protein